jgi:(p)ppGpp synthase/HD superfamily hydrolase
VAFFWGEVMIITKAKIFAEKAHKGQLRKISGAPYFTHLENVALTLFNAGFSNNVVAAGYLHDIIEDTIVTKIQILNLFGNEVVDLVLANSENKSLEWEDRKTETIEKAKTASLEIKAMIAADKLDNTSDLLKQYRLHGDNVWSYFNRGFDKQTWYYQNILEALYYDLEESNVPSYFIKLKRNIEEIFGSF